MLKSRKILIVGLIIPILVLLGIVAQNEYQYHTGTEVEFPIHGYDPRDLLSGHYLRYTIDYGVTACADKTKMYSDYDAFICLHPREFSITQDPDCEHYIRGICRYGEFVAGVERFYASEHTAIGLQQLIRQQQMNVVLSVTSEGSARVKYLIVDGKRFQAR